MTFLTILGVMEILCSFRLVLEGKTGKEILESSRFEFLEKFLANNFALSYAEDNTSGLLNRGGIADLPFLRTLLAIRQKPREPNFRWCRYFWGPWVSFFTTDEFSVRVTKITSRIGVSWTHSLPFLFLTYLNSMNYGHIIKSM